MKMGKSQCFLYKNFELVCLDCPFPTPCEEKIRSDCPFLPPKKNKASKSREKELDKKIKELVEKGLTDRQIAEEVGKAKSTIQARRYKMGLYKNAVEDPCKKCRSLSLCREIGGTCNEKARWSGAPAATSK